MTESRREKRPKRHGQVDTRPAARLLEWFDQARRDLPWRESRDPWGVWVSEVMLQQTQVERVVDYWQRFMTRFPSVEACASAAVDEVLVVWSGLGYYRRARQLHAAARLLCAAGAAVRWPASEAEWRELPGVGEYTAAALASMCLGEVRLAVDANVRRVLARMLGVQGTATAGLAQQLREFGGGLVDDRRPGDSNQALMELGALVCRPHQPRCGECPVKAGCVATRAVRPASLGVVNRKQKRVDVAITIALVIEHGQVLMNRRSIQEGLLAGMWELPWVEAADEQVDAPTVETALAARYGGQWVVGSKLGVVKHAITYRAITATVVRARPASPVEPAGSMVWQRFEAVGGLAVSSLFLKCLKTLEPAPSARPPG